MAKIAARVAALIALTLLGGMPAAAEELDLGELAQCITDSGALFYGAHWCPYCRKQKQSFGEHAGALPYVECYDGPKSEGMNEQCEDQGIESFPTWVFADGNIKTGALSPRTLARDTGCAD